MKPRRRRIKDPKRILKRRTLRRTLKGGAATPHGPLSSSQTANARYKRSMQASAANPLLHHAEDEAEQEQEQQPKRLMGAAEAEQEQEQDTPEAMEAAAEAEQEQEQQPKRLMGVAEEFALSEEFEPFLEMEARAKELEQAEQQREDMVSGLKDDVDIEDRHGPGFQFPARGEAARGSGGEKGARGVRAAQLRTAYTALRGRQDDYAASVAKKYADDWRRGPSPEAEQRAAAEQAGMAGMSDRDLGTGLLSGDVEFRDMEVEPWRSSSEGGIGGDFHVMGQAALETVEEEDDELSPRSRRESAIGETEIFWSDLSPRSRLERAIAEIEEQLAEGGDSEQVEELSEILEDFRSELELLLATERALANANAHMHGGNENYEDAAALFSTLLESPENLSEGQRRQAQRGLDEANKGLRLKAMPADASIAERAAAAVGSPPSDPADEEQSTEPGGRMKRVLSSVLSCAGRPRSSEGGGRKRRRRRSGRGKKKTRRKTRRNKTRRTKKRRTKKRRTKKR